MKSVELNFHHKEFDDLSDRSIRQFMRKVSTAVRQAQLRELSDFIFAQDLDYREKRAIADRLANASREAPAYYVERIEKGSLNAIFAASAFLVAALVRKPVIELIDDKPRRRALLKNLRGYVKRDWAPQVADAIADELAGRELGSRVIARRIRVKEKISKIVVDVKLATDSREHDTPIEPAETQDSIERAIDRRLDDLRRDSER